MLPLLFVGIVLTCSDLLLGQASVQVLPNITVTITPAKATLFAGEMQTFVAIVVGVDDQSVNWAVEEEASTNYKRQPGSGYFAVDDYPAPRH
jgi:hypothetical protein